MYKLARIRLHYLTLSLPECLRGFCKVTLIFESLDKILCHLFLKILENEIWNFGRNLPFLPHLAGKGSKERFKISKTAKF